MSAERLLFTPYQLKGFLLKNRICVPPMVMFTLGGESGRVTDRHVEHYRALVRGGAGLVIQEATSVSREGRLSLDQLGIWEDGQIDGLRRTAEVFHSAGMPAILQLSYGGLLSAGRENQVSPSAYACFGNREDRAGRELAAEEIRRIEGQFIEGARRARRAGYDGVELHGCRGYLLSAFLNPRINRRQDAYRAEDRLIWRNIIAGIRARTPPEFLLGCRLGAFEPDLAAGVANAKWLEAQGVDFLDVYLGCPWEMAPEKPEGYPYSASVYGAARIKQAVQLPVFAAHQIHTGDQAEAVLRDTGADMAVVGRSTLINPAWGDDVRAGRDPGRCFECPECMWDAAPGTCPGQHRLARDRRAER